MITKDKIRASFLENDRIKEFLKEIEEAFKDILDFIAELEGKLFLGKPLIIESKYTNRFLISYKIKRLLFHRSKATYK